MLMSTIMGIVTGWNGPFPRFPRLPHHTLKAAYESYVARILANEAKPDGLIFKSRHKGFLTLLPKELVVLTVSYVIGNSHLSPN